jgi:hypothetical protein
LNIPKRSNQIIKTQTTFPTLSTIFDGINRNGIHLLEYNDSYLKDAFISQLSEELMDQGLTTLFVQEESPFYTLRDLSLCRKLFIDNPQHFPSLSELKQADVYLHYSKLDMQFDDYDRDLSLIPSKSKHPKDYLVLLFQSISQNPVNKFVIIDSHTDYFHSYNLIPQLVSMSFKYRLPILFTSKINSEKYVDQYTLLPGYLKSAFYLHSTHPDLFTHSNSKEIAYEFELDIKLDSKTQYKNYFTLRPSSTYCQQG